MLQLLSHGYGKKPVLCYAFSGVLSKLPLSNPISRETLYQHVYTDKAQGGVLWKNLRYQKKKRKRYARGRDHRGQIPNRRPLSDCSLNIEARRQVGHWECDTVIGSSHKGAVVTMVERKRGYGVMAKVANKTSELLSQPLWISSNPWQTGSKS